MYIEKKWRSGEITLDYAIDFPHNFSTIEKYSVIFYFHGRGFCEKGIKYLIANCPVQRKYMHEEMPFIIISPSCNDFAWMEKFETIIKFIQYVISQEYVDTSRIYLTGSSMGGCTCWNLAVMHPELFTAGVICCGAGMYFRSAVCRISFPVKVYHGTKDTDILPRESEIMVENINAAGGCAELLLCEGVGHDVWSIAYRDVEIYRWLLSKKK